MGEERDGIIPERPSVAPQEAPPSTAGAPRSQRPAKARYHDAHEALAKALFIADHDGSDPATLEFAWSQLGSWDPRPKYRQLAEAALKAIRQPDNKMLKAAAAAMSPEKRPTKKRVSVKAKHGIRYRAMIDAAINEAAQKA